MTIQIYFNSKRNREREGERGRERGEREGGRERGEERGGRERGEREGGRERGEREGGERGGRERGGERGRESNLMGINIIPANTLVVTAAMPLLLDIDSL